jgi:hypothetical protein
MALMPDCIVLIPKDLSVVRRDEIRRLDAMGSSSSDEIVDGCRVTFTRVIDQAEMNADRVLTMEVEVILPRTMPSWPRPCTVRRPSDFAPSDPRH